MGFSSLPNRLLSQILSNASNFSLVLWISLYSYSKSLNFSIKKAPSIMLSHHQGRVSLCRPVKWTASSAFALFISVSLSFVSPVSVLLAVPPCLNVPQSLFKRFTCSKVICVRFHFRRALACPSLLTPMSRRWILGKVTLAFDSALDGPFNKLRSVRSQPPSLSVSAFLIFISVSSVWNGYM